MILYGDVLKNFQTKRKKINFNKYIKELTNLVKDFELTTGAFLKHYCSLGIKCFYNVMEFTWDGKSYKDLVLYVSTPNSKDMYKANQSLSECDDFDDRKDSFKESAEALAIAIKSLEEPKYRYNLLQCVHGKLYQIDATNSFEDTSCENCSYKYGGKQ